MACELLPYVGRNIMEFTRILVAVNSPNGRDAAFERALALAGSSGAELYVLHAVPANQPFSFGGNERLERMVDTRQRAEAAGVRVQTVEQHGDAADIIELHAVARGADLIVMGSEARRGWGRRSWVAERIVRRITIPTLVVASDAFDSAAAFRHVLVAVDLSPASKDVLSGALALTADEAVQLTVMHTIKGLEAADAVQSPGRWMVPEYRGYVLDEARHTLEALVSAIPAAVDARVRVSTGSAAGAILRQAADVNADLVVVGRSTGFRMLGSTALRILRKNARALLVIPDDTQPAQRIERQLAA
jgi:nucleotide-binding universal stress UspA family protein